MRPYTILLLCGCAMLAAAQKQTHSTQTGSALCGPLNGQSFNCPKLGFIYHAPFGWVDRTTEMQSTDTRSTESANEPKTTRTTSQTLLAIFERPPQASGQTINSAVIIAAESRAHYPQVKTAADYFGPISDLAEQSGLKPVGDPYAFPVGSKQVVREDFTGEHGKLPIYQSSLVMITKEQIVSFAFISASEDDVEDLIASLRFLASNSTGAVR